MGERPKLAALEPERGREYGPVQLAKHAGRPTSEINPSESESSTLVDRHLRMGAALAMVGIHAALERRWPILPPC